MSGFLKNRSIWVWVLLMAAVLYSSSALAYEFKLKPGQKCFAATTFGPRTYTLGLDKIIVAVGVRNPYPQENLPDFISEQNFPTYVQNIVKKVFGSCIGDESKIVLAEKSYAVDREVSGTLSIQLEGYVEKDKQVRPGLITHYAVLWLRFYRPDGPYKEQGFFMPHVPGVIFVDYPEETVKERVNGMLGTFLLY